MSSPKNEPGGEEQRPAALPRPTFWPAVAAFGLTFLLWGLVTSPVVLAAGAIALAAATVGWLKELRDEH